MTYYASPLLELLTSSIYSVGFVSVLVCYSSFLFMRKVSGIEDRRIVPKILFCILNVSFAVFTELTGHANALHMTAVPLCLAVEHVIIYKEKFYTGLCYFLILMLLIISSVSLTIDVARLTNAGFSYASSELDKYFLVTMSFATSSVLLFILCLVKPLHHELHACVMSLRRGVLILVYYGISSAVIAVSIQVTFDLMYQGFSEAMRIQVFGTVATKDLLILAMGIVMLFVQAWQSNLQDREARATSRLQTEHGFRMSQQRDALFSFCVNATTHEFVEGIEKFVSAAGAGDATYDEFAQSISQKVIYPDDRRKFSDWIDSAAQLDPSAESKSYQIRLRVNPKALLTQVLLPSRLRSDVESARTKWRWFSLDYTAVRDQETGDVLAYVSLIDVDDDVLAEEKLRAAASTDSLTGLMNRATFEHGAANHLSNDEPGTLFIVDIDHFKNVNDTLGHPVGDTLLKETADLLREATEDGCLVGRIGGDEFCIFVPLRANVECAQNRASDLNERGRRTVSDPSGKSVRVTMSVGAAMSTEETPLSYEELYRKADEALYCAKESGRDRFFIAEP